VCLIKRNVKYCRPMLKEDEHRALSNADTKYDALTQISAIKTTHNDFK